MKEEMEDRKDSMLKAELNTTTSATRLSTGQEDKQASPNPVSLETSAACFSPEPRQQSPTPTPLNRQARACARADFYDRSGVWASSRRMQTLI